MLYTDLFLGQQRVVQTQKDLLSAGFKVRRQTDVTKAVMRSIQKNTGHFYRLLENASKSKEAKDFAFRLASQDYPAFAKRYQNRQLIYNVWILEKPKISV